MKIIGVDPHGSILAFPDHLNHEGVHKYQVEGIGYDFIPNIFDRTTHVDQWIKTHDKESFRMARRLIKEEGLMVGGSSGSVVLAALQIAKELPEDKRVVVILVDGIRNYITKFLNDDWMLEHGYITQEEYDSLQKTSDNSVPYGGDDLISDLDLSKVNPILATKTVSEAIKEFEKQGVENLPVVNSHKKLIGVISNKILSNGLSSYKISLDKEIKRVVSEDFKVLRKNDYIRYLTKAFNRHRFVVIQGEADSYYICEQKHLVSHFLTKRDS